MDQKANGTHLFRLCEYLTAPPFRSRKSELQSSRVLLVGVLGVFFVRYWLLCQQRLGTLRAVSKRDLILP